MNLKEWCKQNNRQDLIEQWSPENEKTMDEYSYQSHESVEWIMIYDDKDSGQQFDFKWSQEIRKRTIRHYDCPYLSGKAVWVGFNDLKTWCEDNNRYDLIEQWSDKNKPMTEYSFGSHDKVIWFLPYDDSETGKHFDFEWKSLIKDRTGEKGLGCPYLSGKAVWVGYNDLKTWCENNDRYDLIEQYSNKNSRHITEYTYGSNDKIIWHIPYDDPITGKHFDFEWNQAIKDRTGNKQAGCPYLSGKAIWVGFNDLVSTYPDLVKEWHPNKNDDKQPCDYSYGSKKKVWWHKSYFDPVTHKMTYLEWEQMIKSRTLKNSDCPLLSGSSMERFTYQYLIDKKIQFQHEYKIKELGSKRFDIYISQYNMMIELDGIQHFTDSKEFFEKGDTPFDKRVIADNMKTNYCKDHNILLLRIPYIYGVQNMDKFKEILDEFIIQHHIPNKIIDWYKQFNFSYYGKIAEETNQL